MVAEFSPEVHAALTRRIEEDLIDGFDEEIELELEDRSIDPLSDLSDSDRQARNKYFKNLFRLQGELVKLQDWVVDHKLKVVVVFEGRDAAGKGGAIKRITQRLNPR
ncbi:MAG TPA: polyphosphate kinase 2, partial [Burkholderiaceae bacterium]